MNDDTLHDLLDRSAPAVETAPRSEVDRMIAEARRVPRRRRARRTAAAASVTLLLLGGAGAAAASDAFSWAPWAQDPVGAVTFDTEAGLSCELRFSEWTGGADPLFVADVNRILREWYETEDIVASATDHLPAAYASVGPVALQPGETVDSLPPGEFAHRQWVRDWSAWDLAVADAEYARLSDHGIRPGDDRFAGAERNGQIQCLDESGRLYAPGVGE